MTQEKVILTPSFHVFAYEMQEAILDGYTINDSNPPIMWGVAYEAHMIKREYPSHEAAVNWTGKQTEVLEAANPIQFSGGAFASTTEPHVQPLTQAYNGKPRGRPKSK